MERNKLTYCRTDERILVRSLSNTTIKEIQKTIYVLSFSSILIYKYQRVI